MNALSVASAVKSTTLTRPSSADPTMMPFAVILKVFFTSPPVAPTISPRALLTLPTTPIVSSARYSTAVATTPTMKSTNETANENFITDHGSTRLRYSRARRGPRLAAAVTVARALRIASLTRLAGPVVGLGGAPPGAAAPGRPAALIGWVVRCPPRPTVAAPRTLALATAAPDPTAVGSAGLPPAGAASALSEAGWVGKIT